MLNYKFEDYDIKKYLIIKKYDCLGCRELFDMDNIKIEYKTTKVLGDNSRIFYFDIICINCAYREETGFSESHLLSEGMLKPRFKIQVLL